ncbi:septal ring lytic transglycosylase RlpA family protein [Thermobifida halotolerans]|uniref:Probable endolytic peptidoglycan transglycosylase RlpA n=2 Tax=Thermobifida halotolerans TaxID=483545 RepID=A0AA97M6C3_9ACTN|nr:septal ring lytic transglycosylase RlpA family protein [Thermobifida halotolerans]
MYGDPQPTASGETFDPTALTAAHKTLPFGTMVEVTNIADGRSVTVRINDRGPYVAGRCLDLSTAAFSAIASPSQGVIQVSWKVVD